jgi:hypothetical protein
MFKNAGLSKATAVRTLDSMFRPPDTSWVHSLVSLVAEEFLPLEFVEKPSFRE